MLITSRGNLRINGHSHTNTDTPSKRKKMKKEGINSLKSLKTHLEPLEEENNVQMVLGTLLGCLFIGLQAEKN